MRARQERPKGFTSWHNYENALKSHIEDACPGMVIVEEDLKKERYGSRVGRRQVGPPAPPLLPRHIDHATQIATRREMQRDLILGRV